MCWTSSILIDFSVLITVPASCNKSLSKRFITTMGIRGVGRAPSLSWVSVAWDELHHYHGYQGCGASFITIMGIRGVGRASSLPWVSGSYCKIRPYTFRLQFRLMITCSQYLQDYAGFCREVWSVHTPIQHVTSPSHTHAAHEIGIKWRYRVSSSHQCIATLFFFTNFYVLLTLQNCLALLRDLHLWTRWLGISPYLW